MQVSWSFRVTWNNPQLFSSLKDIPGADSWKKWASLEMWLRDGDGVSGYPVMSLTFPGVETLLLIWYYVNKYCSWGPETLEYHAGVLRVKWRSVTQVGKYSWINLRVAMIPSCPFSLIFKWSCPLAALASRKEVAFTKKFPKPRWIPLLIVGPCQGAFN